MSLPNNSAQHRAGRKGGEARAEKLSAERRSEIARRAVQARWERARGIVAADDDFEAQPPDGDVFDGPSEGLPVAKYKGELDLLDLRVPCYVLTNGQRVIGRTSMTELLTGIKGGGGLEKYLDVGYLKSLISIDEVLERMVPFRLPEVEGLERKVKGLPADLAIDICRAFVTAMQTSLQAGGTRLSERRMQMALKASMFLASCARIGLEALIDEATGYQYDRARDALQVKLVMELVYEYLDADVAQWLKENAPAPRRGQNYHQWLSSQYGLKKLVEHIWMLIGVARTCSRMTELRDRMAELNGKSPIQLRLYLPREEAML
jgi:P63C domain-containing protein